MHTIRGAVRSVATVIAVLLSAGTIASCGSSGTGPSFTGNLFLQFKANGTPVDFTVQASLMASFADTGSQHDALISGYDATSGLSLVVFDGAAITTGTYSGYTLDTGAGFVKGVLITYYDSHGSYGSGNQNPVNAIVTITSITSTRVQGTFTGTVSPAAGTPAVAITDGQFVVQRAN